MLLLATDPRFALHDTGAGHPERQARLVAVLDGVRAAGLDEAVVELEPRAATREELELVHAADYLDTLEEACARGGFLDPDTVVSPGSWEAARYAAGAGLAAAAALARGEGGAAFLAVRPPGHHAVRERAMGFCLLNNVAVVAAALGTRGESVAVFDWDAHHGNGTQDIFYDDPRVLYVSWHEWPLFPGTGRLDERGTGTGAGTTLNLPLPAGATGDVYLGGFDDVIAPVVERFAPDWVLVSAGFDAHRADPLTGLGLSSGDFAALAGRVAACAPESRLVAFLEGGYDLEALRDSVAAFLPVLVGASAEPSEPATSGGPGRAVVAAARDLWTQEAPGRGHPG